MYYFIGIKGAGMAALACILHDLGNEVAGSDLTKHFFTEEELVKRDIKMYDFNEIDIPDNATVVVGNAFLEDFDEVVKARNNPTLKIYRYHEFLGVFMKDYKAFGVAGSHGKTTTTGMLSSMLGHNEPTGFLIGDGTGYISKDSENFVVEADEFRCHFLEYYPEYAIITNIEIDHVDYFKSEDDYNQAYINFINNVSKNVVMFGDDENVRKLNIHNEKCLWYGLNNDNDIIAKNIIEESDYMEFDVYIFNELYGRFHLPFVGRHMLWNSLGVIGIGYLVGLSKDAVEAGLSSFKGTKRRFTIEYYKDSIYVDDYAHHPTEVKVTIEAAKKRFKDKKIVAIFKPHRASRVKYFVEEFADALKLADKVYLCDFTSIDDKQDGTDIDITYLQERIEGSIVLEEDESGASILAKEAPCVYLFMSSKDIYGLAEYVKRYQIS